MRTHIFLAGIMQGSHAGPLLHEQDYRQRIVRLLSEHFTEADVYDPLADHGQSLDYSDETGRQVFLNHNQMCTEVDVLVAFLPEASMGTAIEMWEAYRHGRLVVAISPLVHNWVVKYTSQHVYADLDEFAAAVADGQFAALVEAYRASRTGSPPGE